MSRVREAVFLHRDTREGDVTIDVAFTGVGLDLAEKPGSDPARTAAAVSELSRSCGVPVVRMHQVHGASVAHVDGTAGRPPQADALVTTERGLALLTRAADCVPLLLADATAGVVAAVHCGRPGLVAGVVPAALAHMAGLGADAVEAWIGPHVCGRCYEVPDAMRDDVAAVVPQAWAQTSWGTPSVDVGAGVRAQLGAAGVPVTDLGICTREDDRVWSYRRDGESAGRAGGVVWIRP